MQVRLSETTYQRLVNGLGLTIPILFEDEHGFKYVDLADEIVEPVREAWGDDIDWGINQTINHNQKLGSWPPAKTSKQD
jgi:hypothetical protein